MKDEKILTKKITESILNTYQDLEKQMVYGTNVVNNEEKKKNMIHRSIRIIMYF